MKEKKKGYQNLFINNPIQYKNDSKALNSYKEYATLQYSNI